MNWEVAELEASSPRKVSEIHTWQEQPYFTSGRIVPLYVTLLMVSDCLWWRFQCTELRSIFLAHNKLLQLVVASLEPLNGRSKH